jgi:hypothetical protein
MQAEARSADYGAVAGIGGNSQAECVTARCAITPGWSQPARHMVFARIKLHPDFATLPENFVTLGHDNARRGKNNVERKTIYLCGF